MSISKGLVSIIGLSIAYLAIAARKINLVTADLGRHIANGKYVFLNTKVFTSNFYSYTLPDSPFTNHHWGSGVLFYGVHQAAGFIGLSAFYLFIGLLGLLLLVRESWRRFGLAWSLLAALCALPLIAGRAEVRPEIFSYFLSILFFQILWRWKDLGGRSLYFLPFLMLLWVNLHILFIFGFLIQFCFLLELKWEKKSLRKPLLVFFACLSVVWINPLGWRLALSPLRIFENYGYMLVENQSMLFFIKRKMLGDIVFSFFFLTAVMLLSLLFGYFSFRRLPSLGLILLTIAFWFLAFFSLRGHPFLGIFSVPLIANSMQDWKKRFLLPVLLAIGVAYDANYVRADFGLGLAEGITSSADFFLEQKLRGPIFNNYDIGGFLIYTLFPQERVFVDNRPEAYTSAFFSQIYIPIQEKEERWKEAQNTYGFNTIYFYWHDYTPWAQEFLLRRVQDSEWVPVYVDSYALILVKNREENRAVIEQFQIPRERFRAR